MISLHLDGDVYGQLQQKERDLILAAELGKALLEKNEELSKQNEKIAEDFSAKLEVTSSNIVGTNLVLGPPEKFYRKNPSGTFRDVHWYYLGDPKKVPGAPSQGFLILLGFDKNITKIENWLSYPHFLANF